MVSERFGVECYCISVSVVSDLMHNTAVSTLCQNCMRATHRLSKYHLLGSLLMNFYSRSQIDYSIRCMFPKWSDWNISYTTKGLWKQRIKRILTLAVFAATIVGAYRSRQSGMSIKSLPSQLQHFVRSTVLQVLGILRFGIDSVQKRI